MVGVVWDTLELSHANCFEVFGQSWIDIMSKPPDIAFEGSAEEEPWRLDTARVIDRQEAAEVIEPEECLHMKAQQVLGADHSSILMGLTEGDSRPAALMTHFRRSAGISLFGASICHAVLPSHQPSTKSETVHSPATPPDGGPPKVVRCTGDGHTFHSSADIRHSGQQILDWLEELVEPDENDAVRNAAMPNADTDARQ